MSFDIRDFGARADGSLCTAPLQRAIDTCFLQGGGEVCVPEGTWLTGGIRLRSGVTLRLLKNAVLLGSTDPEDYRGWLEDEVEPISREDRDLCVCSSDYSGVMGDSAHPCSRWNNGIIRAFRATDVAIVGEEGSEINGQNCFDPLGEEDYRGPHAINAWFCENITLKGYTVRDSANWAHALQVCKNIRVEGISVYGGHDGFDVRSCDNVTVEDCRFLTGDDCIAGFDNNSVRVRRCYFESACSILRFGGNDVLVEDCEGKAPATYAFRGSLSDEEKRNRMPTNGNHRRNCLSVFLYYCDYRATVRGTPGNIVFRNCRFYDPDAVMRLPFGHIWCCNRSLADIRFENCLFDGISVPMRLQCPEEEPLSLFMTDCRIRPRAGYEDIPLIRGKNLREVSLLRVDTAGFTDPKILTESET